MCARSANMEVRANRYFYSAPAMLCGYGRRGPAETGQLNKCRSKHSSFPPLVYLSRAWEWH